jgi:hypothetical protein
MGGEIDGAVAGTDEGIGAQKGCHFGGVSFHINTVKKGRFPWLKCLKKIRKRAWGGVAGDRNKALVGARIVQPLAEELIDTGTEVGGTWRLLYAWTE